MENKKTKYLESKNNAEKLIRAELWFAPFLVILPVIISILLIWSWFYKGYIEGNCTYDGHLILGLIILIGNIVFDVPFIKSLISIVGNSPLR